MTFTTVRAVARARGEGKGTVGVDAGRLPTPRGARRRWRKEVDRVARSVPCVRARGHWVRRGGDTRLSDSTRRICHHLPSSCHRFRPLVITHGRGHLSLEAATRTSRSGGRCELRRRRRSFRLIQRWRWRLRLCGSTRLQARWVYREPPLCPWLCCGSSRLQPRWHGWQREPCGSRRHQPGWLRDRLDTF